MEKQPEVSPYIQIFNLGVEVGKAFSRLDAEISMLRKKLEEKASA